MIWIFLSYVIYCMKCKHRNCLWGLFHFSSNILMPPFMVIPKINLLTISYLLCLMKCMIKLLFHTFEYEIALICWTPIGSYCHHRFLQLLLYQLTWSSSGQIFSEFKLFSFFNLSKILCERSLKAAKCFASASILCSSIYIYLISHHICQIACFVCHFLTN